MYDAKLLVLKAELDAAGREPVRITLRKKIVEVLKEYEKAADQRVKAAQEPASSFRKVKARRLEAEIHLEQAKPKGVKESK